MRIPAIGVDSELVGLGLHDNGSMEVPAGAFPAGWYTGAPTPGELGPAILAGHVDHAGLRLITCGGPFDRSVHSYEDNIVVFAELDPGHVGTDGHRG